MTRITCITGMLFLIISCTNPQKLITDPSKDRICFGRTGGFTNIPMDYVLFDNGQLFKIDQEVLVKICNPGRKQYTELENQMNAIEFMKMELNEPGNITYYIKLVKSGKEKEVKWTDSSENKSIKELYNMLLATIKTQK